MRDGRQGGWQCSTRLLKVTAGGLGTGLLRAMGTGSIGGSGCSVALCGDAAEVIQGTCLVPDGHHLMTDGLDGELA